RTVDKDMVLSDELWSFRAEADALIGRSKPSLEEWKGWCKQARNLASRGEWRRAAEVYERAIHCLPERWRSDQWAIADMQLWCEYGSVLLLDGNQDGYLKLCQRVLPRWSRSNDPLMLYVGARLAVLAPNTVLDAAAPIQMAEKAEAARQTGAWSFHTVA